MSFIKGLLGKRPDAIGIEIGTSAIKVVVLKAGSPPQLQHALMVQTPIGSIRDGVVTEPQAIANEIKALLDEHKITNKYVVTAVANQSAVTRNIMVPRMDRKELQEAVKWEAQRYIPFPIDEVNLDFDLLDAPEKVAEEGQVEAVIAAAPTEAVSKVVEVMKLAGLETTVVDVKNFAALRALRGNLLGQHLTKHTLTDTENYTESGEVVMVLEIGASSSVVSLVRGDRVLMIRNINISADDFTTALQRELGKDFSEAEDIKMGYATATTPTENEDSLLTFTTTHDDYSPAKIFNIVRPVLTDLITEIRRSLEFYRVQSGDIMVDRAYLAGGGAKLRGLAPAISDALGFRVELASPWLSVKTDQANIDPGYLQNNAAEFTVALGLALRGVDHG